MTAKTGMGRAKWMMVGSVALAAMGAGAAAGQSVAVNGNRAAVGATNRVIISAYVVEFQKQLDARSTSNRFLGGGRVNAVVADNTLVGLEAATFQSLADTGYALLVKQLTEAGFVVVPSSEYQGLAEAQALAARSLPSGSELANGDGTSVFFGAAGLSNVNPELENGEHLGAAASAKNGGLLGGLGAMAQQFKTVGTALSDLTNIPPALESRLAKAANAHVLKVWQVVNFGAVKAQAGVNVSSSGASATLFLNGLDSRLALRTPSATTSALGAEAPVHVVEPGGLFKKRVTYTPPNDGDFVVRLKDDLLAGSEFLAGPVRDATTTSQKVGTAITVLGAMAFGTGGVTQYKSYQTPADAAKYQQAVAELLSRSQAAYIAALK